MKKQRILILENSIAPTGALFAILRNATALMERYDFLFVLPAKSTARKNVEDAGFEVVELTMVEISKRPIALVLYLPMLLLNAFRFSAIVRNNSIDLIHSNDLYNLIPSFYKLFGGARAYLCHVRFMPARFPRILKRIWFGLHYRFASKVVAVSDAVIKELPDNKKNVRVYDGISSTADHTYTPPPGNSVLLYLANFTQGKGQEFALRAFAPVSKKFPRWTLKFAGGDMGMAKNMAFRKALEQEAKRLRIESQVQFSGFVADAALAYKEADVILNFSDSESFSLTCLEAQYSGRPVIATRSGGPAEIVEDYTTGYLVSTGDVEAMTTYMEMLMRDRQIVARMGEAAFQSIQKRFGRGSTTDRLGALYDELLKKAD